MDEGFCAGQRAPVGVQCEAEDRALLRRKVRAAAARRSWIAALADACAKTRRTLAVKTPAGTVSQDLVWGSVLIMYLTCRNNSATCCLIRQHRTKNLPGHICIPMDVGSLVKIAQYQEFRQPAGRAHVARNLSGSMKRTLIGVSGCRVRFSRSLNIHRSAP